MRAVFFSIVLCFLFPVPGGKATLYDSQNITIDCVGMNEEDAIHLLLDAGYHIVKRTYKTGG